MPATSTGTRKKDNTLVDTLAALPAVAAAVAAAGAPQRSTAVLDDQVVRQVSTARANLFATHPEDHLLWWLVTVLLRRFARAGSFARSREYATAAAAAKRAATTTTTGTFTNATAWRAPWTCLIATTPATCASAPRGLPRCPRPPRRRHRVAREAARSKAAQRARAHAAAVRARWQP